MMLRGGPHYFRYTSALHANIEGSSSFRLHLSQLVPRPFK